MITRVPKTSFHRSGVVGPVFRYLLPRRFSSNSNDDKDSPAGLSVEPKNVLQEDDDRILEAVIKVSKYKPKLTKHQRANQRPGASLKEEESSYNQQPSWVEQSINKQALKKKFKITDETQPLGQFSEAVKALRRTPKPSPLDIIDDSFFVARRRQTKIEQTKEASWKLKPKEFDVEVKEAAKRVTAQAGEASAVLEDELLKGLDLLDPKEKRKQFGKKPTTTGVDLDLLNNVDFDAIDPKKKQKQFEKKPTTTGMDLDLLNNVDFDALDPKKKQTQFRKKPTTTGVDLDLLNNVDFDAAVGKASHQPQSKPIQRQLHPDLDLLDKINVNEVLAQFPQNQEKTFDRTSRRNMHDSAKLYNSLDELLSEPPLNIFTNDQETIPDQTLRLWSTFEQAELQRNTCFEPSNWWAQCIQWTEEGKLWHFPIDNEQGMHEEENVDFSEHIFLDKHIESWCPKQGPIKHFMELVLIGLSKNPYLSVEEKVQNIDWFRQYFEKHRTLLQEINVLDTKSSLQLDSKHQSTST